jgi:RimJ/RimL family protein N-acetyltransferase
MRSGALVQHDGAMPKTVNEIQWPIDTARLSIRPVVPADADAMWAYRSLQSVTTWMTTSAPDRDEFARYLAEPDRLAKTLVIEHDGTVIGDLMIAIEDAWAQTEVADQARGVQAELGWCLSPEHVGHGYATEAVAEIIRISFEELGLHRVTANCFAANEASWRLMERLGMRREQHTVRESLHRSGVWHDGFGYALLAEEWADTAAGRASVGQIAE